MSIKNVVKVMNFHSLLRVDKARDQAKRYEAVETVLTEMIDNIVNNRNIVLDVTTLRVKANKPELVIYLGSDMGFCNNLNTLVKKQLDQTNGNVEQIIIGRKLKTHSESPNVILFMLQEEYLADNLPVMNILEGAIRELKYSKVSIVYNHYYNSSEVEMVQKQIFPVQPGNKNKDADDKMSKFRKQVRYNEDFTCEGDIDKLLTDLVVLYMKYSMEIAVSASYAAENIARQNVTTESLKKIEEREIAEKQQERRVNKDKQFAKVLDNYTKLKAY